MDTLSWVWPTTLREINDLPERTKQAIYEMLIPPWVFARFGVEPERLLAGEKPAIEIRCPSSSHAMELIIKPDPDAQDPLLYLHLADSLNYQLQVLLLVINNPDGPRFNIDVDEQGRPTHWGTTRRNVPEEIRAMAYGLAPGQVRPGLRVLRVSLPTFETFVCKMKHDFFFMEPLFYHSAIVAEQAGFAYVKGRKRMEAIHQAFQPGGALYACLNGSTPFRAHSAWITVRGRSWAIQDGVLGRPFTDIKMYKRIGHHAGIMTYPRAVW